MNDDTTGDLFSEPPRKKPKALARNTDPDTSHAAAGRVNVSAKEAIVMEALRQAGRLGLTVREISDETGLSLWTTSPRMRPLVNKGLVEETDLRREKMIVWRAL